MRFGGEMNIDLNELATNLVPYKELNLCLINFSPFNQETKTSQNLKQLFSLGNGFSSVQRDSFVVSNLLIVQSKLMNFGVFSQTFDQIIKNDEFL
jgi:hypothetical protein